MAFLWPKKTTPLITIRLIATLPIPIPIPIAAQDFNKGLATYEAGDCGTTLKEWIPLDLLSQNCYKVAIFSLG